MEEKGRVTSVGGIFFKSNNPGKIMEWYSVNLGLNTDEYGTSFAWKSCNEPHSKGFTQWSPFKSDTKYFTPSKKEFMINYRVDDLDAILHKLKKNNVQIIGEIESYEYGRFVHIMDPEGNKIELWEPCDKEFEKISVAVTE